MNMKFETSTWFLRLALIAITVLAILFCIFVFPEMWRSFDFEDQMLAKPMRGVIVRWYISVIPFLFGLWQSWKLLGFIDRNVAFSEASTKALRTIKHCAIVIAVVMASALPFFYGFAELDDAPGVVIVGMMFVGGPVAVAVFAALLQKLLKSAIDMKSENELTV